ncbi:hypothetical protein Glove_114g95 [Diversispora epigaea]|uniref:Uncharacterized protein n=1 Tax=Diversispora epigaea TaxID=1348612 RepID=A0A397J7Q6_9GLOM|nr:hypothetical protein Glove_114g95 [Diversispora epigaea]
MSEKISEYRIDNNNDKEKNIDGTYTYNSVGFCTLYLFYYLPCTKKNREKNENNHGNHRNHHMNEDLNENFSNHEKNKRHLLQITNNQDVPILNNIRLQIVDPRIRQLIVTFFLEIRDKCDMGYLREMKALEGLSAPVDKND